MTTHPLQSSRWPRQNQALLKPFTCTFASAAAESHISNRIHEHQLCVEATPRWKGRGMLPLHVLIPIVSFKQGSFFPTSSSFLPGLPPLLHTLSHNQQGHLSMLPPIFSMSLENNFIIEYILPLSSFPCVPPHSPALIFVFVSPGVQHTLILHSKSPVNG